MRRRACLEPSLSSERTIRRRTASRTTSDGCRRSVNGPPSHRCVQLTPRREPAARTRAAAVRARAAARARALFAALARRVAGVLGRPAVAPRGVCDGAASARAVVAATPAGRRLGGRAGVRAPAPQVLGIREREGDVGEAGVRVGAESLDRSLQRGRGRGAEVGAELEVPNERVGLAELVAVDEGDDDALGGSRQGASGSIRGARSRAKASRK